MPWGGIGDLGGFDVAWDWVGFYRASMGNGFTRIFILDLSLLYIMCGFIVLLLMETKAIALIEAVSFIR
jgi:hypothetical protein